MGKIDEARERRAFEMTKPLGEPYPSKQCESKQADHDCVAVVICKVEKRHGESEAQIW
jgi:hypothetical protein